MGYRDELEAARARIRVLEDHVEELLAKAPAASLEQLREERDRALLRIRSLELEIGRLLAALVEVSGDPDPTHSPPPSPAEPGRELDRIRELARRAILTYVGPSPRAS